MTTISRQPTTSNAIVHLIQDSSGVYYNDISGNWNAIVNLPITLVNDTSLNPPYIYLNGQLDSSGNLLTDSSGNVLLDYKTDVSGSFIPVPFAITSSYSESNSLENGDLKIYLKKNNDNPSIVQYSYNSTVDWGFDISTYPTAVTFFPIFNLQLNLITDITINNADFYFVIGSKNIVITGFNSGTTNKFNINGISQYRGLIKNGDSSGNKFEQIQVNNLGIDVSGSTLADGAGWFAQSYYGYGDEKYLPFIKCYSNGPINGVNSGGILGSYSRANPNNCFTTGVISGALSGGIAGSNSNSEINYCYTTGNISGDFAGGLAGSNATRSISNSYTLGNVTGFGSGSLAGGFASVMNIYNCFQNGLISGLNAGPFVGTGDSSGNYSRLYAGLGSWLDASANSILMGGPTYDESSNLVNPRGDTWCVPNPTTSNQPWIFSLFGNSPYSTLESQQISQTISAGQSSMSALNPTGHTYSLIAINNAKPSTISSITINGATGAIQTSPSTPTGLYTIYVKQNSDYITTKIELTLEAPCYLGNTKILCLVDGVEQYIEIKDLTKNTLVKTYSNGYKKVLAKGKLTLQNSENSTIHKLYKMSKSKNQNLMEDLYVSGKHSILVDNIEPNEMEKMNRENQQIQEIGNKKLIMAFASNQFEEVSDNLIYDLYQIVLDNPNPKKRYGIYANGILSESMSLNVFKKKQYMVSEF